MNKARLLKWVNPILFISAVIQIVTILVFLFNLFPAKKHFFFELHEHNGIIFVILIFIHLYLNWAWVKVNFFRKR